MVFSGSQGAVMFSALALQQGHWDSTPDGD